MEIILSVGVIAVIAASSMPIFVGMQKKNELDIAANAVVSSLRRAQTLSIAMDRDSTWGVSISSGAVTIFRGASYTTRTTAQDEVFAISTGIVPTGLGEVVFAKLSGDPLQTGTITLTYAANIRTVTINSVGTIDY